MGAVIDQELDVKRDLDVDETGRVLYANVCRAYGYFVSNANAAALFLKFYDKVTAPDENDTPKLTFRIPAGASGHYSIAGDKGIRFLKGLSARCTTGVADTDTGAPGANDLVLNLYYK